MLQTLHDIDWAPLWLTLRVATLATAAACLAGVGLGWLFARTRLPGRRLLEAVCMLPLVLPPTVLGYALLLMMGRRGPLGSWLREHFDYSLIFHWHGVVDGHGGGLRLAGDGASHHQRGAELAHGAREGE